MLAFIVAHKLELIGLGYVIVDEIFAFSPALKSNSILNFIYNSLKSAAGK